MWVMLQVVPQPQQPFYSRQPTDPLLPLVLLFIEIHRLHIPLPIAVYLMRLLPALPHPPLLLTLLILQGPPLPLVQGVSVVLCLGVLEVLDGEFHLSQAVVSGGPCPLV